MRESLSREGGTRSGQVAVFCLMGLLILFLGIALLGQVGLMTHHACHAQAVADTSAMSGAVTQAATLNHMARLNQEIVDTYEELVDTCSSTIFPSRSAALETISQYEEIMAGYREMMEEESSSGASKALWYAWLITLLNSESAAEFEYLGTEDLARDVMPDSFYEWEERTVTFYYISGDTVVSGNKRVTTWMEKDPNLIIAFASGARYDTQPGFHGEGLLGSLPSLRTAGQAKPYGGRIYEPDPSYLAKLIALKTANAPFARRFGAKAQDYEH